MSVIFALLVIEWVCCYHIRGGPELLAFAGQRQGGGATRRPRWRAMAGHTAVIPLTSGACLTVSSLLHLFL